MKIEDKLVASVINGLKALYGQEVPEKMVQLQKTKKEFEGHLTLVVFPFLKMSRKGPEQTAQEIGEYLKVNEPAVAAFNVIKGFLNLTIASATWIDLLNEIQADEQYGLVKATETSPLVMIEYSSPNTNKPLHLGHVRNNLLGNALANIVAANGNTTYQNLKSISSIYSGSNVKINCGVTVCTYSIQGYSTYRAPINGSLLLAPGMNHIIEVFPINCNQLGYGVVGFDWWAEPFQKIVESDL